jgi:transcriptional regulator with XRE-family HTH domain
VSKTKSTQADELFRDLLKERRVKKKITQADLAERLSVPQSYVSKYEVGERRLDFVETVLVCQALGTDFAEFAADFVAQFGNTRLRK